MPDPSDDAHRAQAEHPGASVPGTSCCPTREVLEAIHNYGGWIAQTLHHAHHHEDGVEKMLWRECPKSTCKTASVLSTHVSQILETACPCRHLTALNLIAYEARAAIEFGKAWSEEHAKDDHLVTIDHKDEMELARLVGRLCDALAALDQRK